ncbi:MAG: hypothetical protein KC492_33555 [Myxococcales bacterium]|nr:hypothetical protein [Myxococcales bacterium]
MLAIEAPAHLAAACPPRSLPGKQQLTERVLAFIEVKLDEHDLLQLGICELAVICCNPTTLKVLDEYSARIESQCDATDFEPCDGSIPLAHALSELSWRVRGGMIVGHQINATWAVLERAFRRAGLDAPHIQEHRVDVASIAWPLLAQGEVESLSLTSLAAWSGCPPQPGLTCLTQARQMLEVARVMNKRAEAGRRVMGLVADERQIADSLLGRLEQGRSVYGPWRVEDGRDYPSEAYEEVLDALHYVAAKLVQLNRRESEVRS